MLAVLALIGALIVSPWSKKPAAAHVSSTGARRRAVAWKVLVALDVVVAAALGLTFVLASPPAATPKPATQTGTLTYGARVPVSDTYPTGEVTTGDPVFVKLLSAPDIAFHYATDALPASVTGTGRLDITLLAASGWHTTIPLVAPTTLAAGTLVLTGTLDLTRMQAMADSVAKATGAGAGGGLDVTVTASTTVSVDGAAPVTYSLPLPFKLSSLALTPVTPKATASTPGEAVTSTSPLGEAPKPATDPARQLRMGFMVALLAGLCVTVVIWPESATRDADATLPEMAHTLAVGADLTAATRIQLADGAALQTLATSLGCPVVEGHGGWQAVFTPGAIYWTGTPLPADAGPAAAPIEPHRPSRRGRRWWPTTTSSSVAWSTRS